MILSHVFSMMNHYFEKKEIRNFRIEDIKLQIVGEFTDKRKSEKRV